MTKSHALVIGGSLGGLMISRLLLAQGWTVDVFERSTGDLSSRGAGLGSQPALFDLFRRLNLQFDESIALPIGSRACLGPDGAVLCEISLREVSTAWDIIYRLLRTGLPDKSYHRGTSIEGFECEGDLVEAISSDGSRRSGDLLVGADGIHSTIRRQLLTDTEPTYAGYVSWRGLIAREDIPGEFRGCLLERMNFCFPDGEMVLTVPVPDVECSTTAASRCQFSWFRPMSRSMFEEQFGVDPLHQSISPLCVPPGQMEQLKQRSRKILPPPVSHMIGCCVHPLVQPILDYEPTHMTLGRVALLGDAACIARPHVGTGVTKAALDAVALADALGHAGTDIRGALMRYEAERLPAGKQLVARGRALGAYLSAQMVPRDQRDASGLYRDPARYMQSFGSGAEVAASA